MNETPPEQDEADAADEELERRTDVPTDAPVPEADALEQAADATPSTADDEPDEVGDRPEADALDQARSAGGDDDERR